jgi:hypothetical protein
LIFLFFLLIQQYTVLSFKHANHNSKEYPLQVYFTSHHPLSNRTR